MAFANTREMSPAQNHTSDRAVFDAIAAELERQQNQIELIASENIVSKEVLRAQGSVMTNKYAEGYPGKRYYGGCAHVDVAETLAIERATKLFGCRFANVQPHSGAQANQAVFLALLSPGDTTLGMDLSAGGHLTHGAKPNLSGRWFNALTYGVRRDDDTIDFDAIEQLCLAHRPKLLIAGGSAYARTLDFQRFRALADSVGAYLLVDMAHYAGLIAGGAYPNPFPYAHIATTTTHKTLRGPRGGMILTDDEALAKKINSAVFPGLQGGPLMHVIAAKAVAFGEALQPDFRSYAANVVANARAMAQALMDRGIRLVGGGTDCHMVLIDLRQPGEEAPTVTGQVMETLMEEVGLTCNKNSIPNDPLGPIHTSGIRVGSPAGTTRGFDTAIFAEIGTMIADLIHAARTDAQASTLETPCTDALDAMRPRVQERVLELCHRYPIYS